MTKFLVFLKNRTPSNESSKRTGLLKNKQFWATVKFLPGAFFRLILKFIMSNETFSKPQYLIFTKKKKKKEEGGRTVRTRMCDLKRKEKNQAMGETRIKLSNKTVSLGPTQIDSKLRQSIP